MSFYNTGNPVPSIDPRDLDDNAKHIDEIANSTLPTFTDRTGSVRKTLYGIIDDNNSLAANLANASDPAKGAALVARNWQAVDRASDLRTLLKTSPAKYAESAGGLQPGDGGHALYVRDDSDTTSADNGVTVFVNVPTGARWKLNHNGTINNKQACCVSDGTADDTAKVQTAISTVGSIGFTRGWTQVTQQLTIPASNKLELYGGITGAGLKANLPNGAYLINNALQVAGDTRIHVHDLEINFTNINSKGFKIASTILPVIFENLYIQNGNDIFDFSELYANPTINNVICRSLTSGRSDAFVLQCNSVNTLAVDGLSATGSWGFGVQLFDNAGIENYSNSLKNVTMQGTSGNLIGRAFYSRGGDVSLDNLYVERSSVIDTVYLDGVGAADLGLIRMTTGSIYAKNSNVTVNNPSFITIAGNVSQIVSENSNIFIANFNNLTSYEFRFQRSSSGRIKVGSSGLGDTTHAKLGPIASSGAFGSSTVTTNTPLQTAGLQNVFDVAVSGQPTGFNNGVTLNLPNTATLPAGTPLTVVIRVNKKTGTALRVQTVGSDFTAVYPIPVTSYQTANGWADLVIHLKSVNTGFNGSIRVTLDGDGTATLFGYTYLGWIEP